MKVLDSNYSRNIEQRSIGNGISLLNLMDNAGKSVSAFIKDNLVDVNDKNGRIVILCGKGNNGGDGFVIASDILNVINNITVILVDGKPKTSDALHMFEKLKNTNIEIIEYTESAKIEKVVGEADIIIDAIYGIGFRGKINENISKIIDIVNNSKAKVVSVDIPSGMCCDTGIIENDFIRPDYTITFTNLKPVHVLFPSSDYCGNVLVRNVGIPEYIVDSSESIMNVIDRQLVKESLPEFLNSANKKDRGRLFSLCSSIGMPGASIMAAKAALRTGVGLLELAVLRENYNIVTSHLLEPVFTVLDSKDGITYSFDEKEKILNSISKATACLIGCGLGISSDTEKIVCEVIKNSSIPMVIDADGINIVSKNISILKKALSTIILTPHPGEMARLIGTTATEVQRDRYNIAKRFSIENNVVLVLKGANTIVALPDGKVYVNLTGNDGLAKGGSGDVLAGMMSSFLAQGLSAEKAACCSVYLHGLSGDMCRNKYSKAFMLPTDVVNELYKLFLEIKC